MPCSGTCCARPSTWMYIVACLLSAIWLTSIILLMVYVKKDLWILMALLGGFLLVIPTILLCVWGYTRTADEDKFSVCCKTCTNYLNLLENCCDCIDGCGQCLKLGRWLEENCCCCVQDAKQSTPESTHNLPVSQPEVTASVQVCSDESSDDSD
jgi:hypothetical protein